MKFYLGIQSINWLDKIDVPVFISARELRKRTTFPRAKGKWALDSGGFTELSMYGRWKTGAMQYSSETRYWMNVIGNMEWAAPQDWMCEPFILAKTGFTVKEHQRQTVENFILLNQLACDLPWMPIIQGWMYKDYMDHVKQYEDRGIDLKKYPHVGVGSVCRRQNTNMVERLIENLYEMGINIHGFGFKTSGLMWSARYMKSADSMAWSMEARHNKPLVGCKHKHCGRCLKYALLWRESPL